MTVINRLLALITALTIIVTTSMFAYGLSVDLLSQYLSFDIIAQFAKISLTLAMLIIAFFPRPRSWISRFVLGAIATVAIGTATVEALSGTLLTGDAFLVLIGVMIASFESVEVTMPHHKTALSLGSTTPVNLSHRRS